MNDYGTTPARARYPGWNTSRCLDKVVSSLPRLGLAAFNFPALWLFSFHLTWNRFLLRLYALITE